MQFKKAIIYLDGVSSWIHNLIMVRKNIYDCLRALNIEYEEYENNMGGFSNLKKDFNNKDGVLYIVCDSLVYHLCDNSPVIIISRSLSWAQSSPKKNCIGRLTQEQIEQDWSELAALISLNKPIRQFYDHKAANEFLVYNEYDAKNTDEFYRNSMASASWARLASLEYHTKLSPYKEENDALPFVGNMLKAGLSLSSHPDDLIILINRDICLVKESIGIIRSFMDSRNINHCYSHRVNIPYTSHLDFGAIKEMPHDWGVDMFIFRPESPVIEQLCSVNLYLGRTDWDNYWASIVKNRLPYNISYHFPHVGEWKANLDEKNVHNQQTIWNADRELMIYDEVGFRGLGPVS
jgi:hypothetical protein